MQNDTLELDKMQSAYKAAVEEWIAAIKQEEALASVNHSVASLVSDKPARSQGWRTFLSNHSPETAAIDLFVAPPLASTCSMPSSSFG